MSKPFVGCVKVGGEWFGVHVLTPTQNGWYEYRIDYPGGDSESGVVKEKDAAPGEHPDAMNAFCSGFESNIPEMDEDDPSSMFNGDNL